MTNFLRNLGTSMIASGLLLAGVGVAQVVEERPVRPGDRPVAAEAPGPDEGLPAVRRVSEILSGESMGPGDEGRTAAISDLIMDAEGRPHYILLSRGGVAGIGGEKTAVPFGIGQFRYVEEGGWQLDLGMTGERLEQAPTLEEGSLDQLRDPNWIQANRQFFGADAAAAASETVDESFLFRASALKDAEIRGNDGDESIASVDEILLGPDLRATYAILGFGGVAGLGKAQVPVPFALVRLSTRVEQERNALDVAVDLSKEQIQGEASPRLDGEFNRMLDPAFLDRVDEYFGIDRPKSGIGTIEPQPEP